MVSEGIAEDCRHFEAANLAQLFLACLMHIH
jgi:hypothetical protein